MKGEEDKGGREAKRGNKRVINGTKRRERRERCKEKEEEDRKVKEGCGERKCSEKGREKINKSSALKNNGRRR